MQAMVERRSSTFGGVDILVNNAGVGKIIPFFETTEADWDFMFDVNCKGLLWCSQAVAKQMIEQGRGGKIINLASQAGRRGEALVLAYCASKACVISMNQSMALALAPAQDQRQCDRPRHRRYAVLGRSRQAVREAAEHGDRRAEADVHAVDSDGPHRAAGGCRRRGGLPRLVRRRLHHPAVPECRRRQLAELRGGIAEWNAKVRTVPQSRV